jgi:hypothetical protein
VCFAPLCRPLGSTDPDALMCDYCGYVPPKARPKPPEVHEVYICALDLGQIQDHSALVGVKRTAGDEEASYAVRSLLRFPLGTPYKSMTAKVASLLTRPPYDKARLVVDQTGVGRAVVEMFTDCKDLAGRIIPVCITAGHTSSFHDRAFYVPKKELVSTVQAIISSRRLAIDDIPEGPTLKKEFGHFTAKITLAGNEQFEAWRERDHDDEILALALALWFGEARRAMRFMVITGQPDPELPRSRPWSGLFSGQW